MGTLRISGSTGVLLALGLVSWLLGCVDVKVEPTVQAESKDTAASTAPQNPEPRGILCSQDVDCLPTGVCIAGICGRQCAQDVDCSEGLVCVDFRCDLDAAPTPADATAQDTHSSQPDTFTPPPEPDVESSVGTQPYGGSCESKDECQSGLCLKAGEKPGLCTKTCFAPVECPGTDTCYDVGGGNSVCAPNDSGTPCSVGCYSTLSLSNETGQCVCAAVCNDANKCPEGFACGLVAAGTGNQKVCVAVGVQCLPDQPSPCFDKCVTDNGGVSGYCTASCQSALDCPSGWLCDTTLFVCFQ